MHVAKDQLQTRVAIFICCIHGRECLVDFATHCVRLNELPVPTGGILREQQRQCSVRLFAITQVPMNNRETSLLEAIQSFLLCPLEGFFVALVAVGAQAKGSAMGTEVPAAERASIAGDLP